LLVVTRRHSGRAPQPWLSDLRTCHLYLCM